MCQALRSGDDFVSSQTTVTPPSTENIYSLALEERLRVLSLTRDEYRRRVAIKLKGFKTGVTSDAEIDLALTLASKDILLELESLWIIENGVWKGWKIQSGDSIEWIKSYVLSTLEYQN